MTYRTFLRSCRNWTEFALARKRTVRTGLTLEEARSSCEQYNRNRSSAEVRRGTKMEFERE